MLTLVGNSVWCLVLAAAGWALGSNWDTFHKDFRYVEYAVVAGIVVVAAYWVLRLRRTATIAPADDDPPR
jgi:membrane protein DedA with SNARE-associated domain